ncbi:MAG: hypothetical protein ACPLKZ_02700 [Candidatus Bathyarchaeales archaeon]
MGTDFPFLEKALSGKPELKQMVYENYRIEYLKYLDKLFQELYVYSCKGIEIKVSETSADMVRFQALISELEFARYFAGNKMHVELLSNNAFQGRKAPDMLVKTDSKDYFVEVKNIQLDDEEHDFGMKVAQALNYLNMSFMVVIKSASFLATPAYKYQTREQKEKSCEKALSELKHKLQNISQTSFPITVSTSIADIELHPTKIGRSYLGITTIKEAISVPPDYKEKIRYEIIQKSKKRNEWTGKELEKFYIIGIDDASWLFDIDWYNIELFGKATEYCYPSPVPEVRIDSKIENAIKKGWEYYLRKMHILHNNRSVIPENERGMFFAEGSMKNLTAILVRGKNHFYLLANPFAEERINNLDIFEDFKNCQTGWK